MKQKCSILFHRRIYSNMFDCICTYCWFDFLTLYFQKVFLLLVLFCFFLILLSLNVCLCLFLGTDLIVYLVRTFNLTIILILELQRFSVKTVLFNINYTVSFMLEYWPKSFHMLLRASCTSLILFQQMTYLDKHPLSCQDRFVLVKAEKLDPNL